MKIFTVYQFKIDPSFLVYCCNNGSAAERKEVRSHKKKKRNTVIFMLTYFTGIVELKKRRKGEEVVQISVKIDEQVHEVWLPSSGSFFFYHNHLGRPFFYQVFYNAPYHLQWTQLFRNHYLSFFFPSLYQRLIFF